MNSDFSSDHLPVEPSDALPTSPAVADQALPEQRLQPDAEDRYSDFSSGEEQFIDELLDAIDQENEEEIIASATQTTLPQKAPSALPDIEDYPSHVAVPATRASPAANNSWQAVNAERSYMVSNSSLENTGQKEDFSQTAEEQHKTRELGELVSGVHWIDAPGSAEGRSRDRQREVEREQRAIAEGEPEEVLSLSPLQRFRQPPRKALSVTDLVSPAWCELQFWYTLSKLGRKKPTAAMKQGTVAHKILEDQVHVTLPVDIPTREDGWALRIWNVIQSLRTLRTTGMTREFEVWGTVDGEIVTGVIDQISNECPDPELEASEEGRFSAIHTSPSMIQEGGVSINDYFLSASQGAHLLSDLSQTGQVSENNQVDIPQSESKSKQKSKFTYYILDVKTRQGKNPSVPTLSSSSFRPTALQLQLYYHFLTRLITTEETTIEAIASRYNLDVNAPFSDSFLAQMLALNEQFETESNPSNPTDDIPFPLEYNNLSSLWDLMKSQLRMTFLDPSSLESSMDDPNKEAALSLSPLLTAAYISPPDPDSPQKAVSYIGSRSFIFESYKLYAYLNNAMRWWHGLRPPRGVQVWDAWKCRMCDFYDECEWRKEKDEEVLHRVLDKKKETETNLDLNPEEAR